MSETALLRDTYHELLINCFDVLLYNKPVLVNLAKYNSNGNLQKLKLILCSMLINLVSVKV